MYTNSIGDMVPASILIYGSILMLLTVRPVVFRRRPLLEAIMPLPTPEMTPNFAHLLALQSPMIDTTARLTSRNQNVLHHALVHSGVEGWNWRRQKVEENAL